MTLVAHPRQLAVLQLIRRSAPLTRGEIARHTGLSASQVSRLTGELIEGGLIVAAGRTDTEGGRPSDLLALAPGGRYVVGLDVGGGTQRGVVVNLRGEVIAGRVDAIPVTTDRTVILEGMAGGVERLLGEAGVSPAAVLGLGIGVYAIVDPTTGVVARWPEHRAWSSAWEGFPLREALAARLPWARVTVDDTVRMLGVAEARYGHGVGERDFLYVFADSGIGAAILLDGRPYLGPNRLAGEIGHIVLDEAPVPCGCGNVGCLEALASTTALLQEAASWWSGPELTIDGLIAAGERGDPRAVALLAAAGERLGRVLAIVLNLLAPRLVVIGGTLAASGAYVDAAWSTMDERALDQATQTIRLARSRLGPFAGAWGAATVVLDGVFAPAVVDGRGRGRRGGPVPRRPGVAKAGPLAPDGVPANPAGPT